MQDRKSKNDKVINLKEKFQIYKKKIDEEK